MKQFSFSNARGMTLNNLQARKDLCLLLDNFISDENGIYIRKGLTKAQEVPKDGVVVSYHFANKFLFLIPSLGKVLELAYNQSSSKEVLNNFPNNEIVGFLESNQRVIVFFDNRTPFVIFKNSDENYEGADIKFSGVGSTNSFSGAAVYKEHIFFFKRRSPKLYYTQPLAFQGELKEYNIEGIFGVKGSLEQLFTMGFNAGAHVTSYMLAIFDSGDILVFNGINPEDASGWQVVLKTSLNTKVYKEVAAVGTTAYVLTARGIVDIGRVISTNSLDISGSIISNDLVNSYDGEAKNSFWENYHLKEFGNFLLIYNKHSNIHYLYNFRTGGFSKISGWEIDSLAVVNEDMYISKNNNIFQAFRGNNDNGNRIVAEYVTNFANLGSAFNKRASQAILTLKHSGEYEVFFNLEKDNLINKAISTPVFLSKNKSIFRWSDFKYSWSAVKAKLWGGAVNDSFITTKITRNKKGRTIASRLKVINLDTSISKEALKTEFVINNITINYETLGS